MKNCYPENHLLFLGIYAHCAAADGDLKSLLANIPNELNKLLEREVQGAKFNPAHFGTFPHILSGGRNGEFGVAFVRLIADSSPSGIFEGSAAQFGQAFVKRRHNKKVKGGYRVLSSKGKNMGRPYKTREEA